MNASITTFSKPMVSTAQFGNASDSHGYSTNTPVLVLATKLQIAGNAFLVLDPATGVVGRALKVKGDSMLMGGVEGEYYCTAARRVAGLWNSEHCLESLGFGNVDSSIVDQLIH
jgi:hypothetical protein